MGWDWQVRPKGWFRLLGPMFGPLGGRLERRIWTGLKHKLGIDGGARSSWTVASTGMGVRAHRGCWELDAEKRDVPVVDQHPAGAFNRSYYQRPTDPSTKVLWNLRPARADSEISKQTHRTARRSDTRLLQPGAVVEHILEGQRKSFTRVLTNERRGRNDIRGSSSKTHCGKGKKRGIPSKDAATESSPVLTNGRT
jgi:hypothetical protein